MRLAKLPSTRLMLPAIVVLAVALYASRWSGSEPYFNNDETRHVMTGVFVYDLLRDLPQRDLEDYVWRYYAQYPALGLLVWPPLFYVCEGAWMLALGPSMLAAHVTVLSFAALGCIYLYLLVHDSHGPHVAAVATALFAACPLIVLYATHVMLEVPYVACSLATMFHVSRYLDGSRRRHLWLGAAAFCATALMRYDAIVLVPSLGLLLVLRGRTSLLARREVLLAAAATVLVLLPYYWLFAKLVGHVQFQAALTGAEAGPGLFSLENLLYYPRSLPGQVGWLATVAAMIGLGGELLRRNVAGAAVFLALILATYFTFTLLAENASRHAVHWVPAFAAFAAIGVSTCPGLTNRPARQFAATLVLLLGTLAASVGVRVGRVEGYAAAAEYVVEHSGNSPTCLVDSYLDGNFTYQVRRHDPERRLWVLRGDKIFYSTVSTPHSNYVEWVDDEREMLELLDYYDPQYVVVEQPRVLGTMPLGARLRSLLAAHPERFRLEKEFPLDTNLPLYKNTRLLVYRRLLRSQTPRRSLEIRMLWPRRTITIELPDSVAQQKDDPEASKVD